MEGARTILGLSLEERGTYLRSLPDGLPIELFEAMAQLRAFDERAVILQRQGVIGTYPTYYGEEAVQAASVLALTKEDWLFPTYRQTAVVTLRGCPPDIPLLMWRGHPGGWHDVMEYRVAPVCVPVATNYPHAVGAAWGARLRRQEWIALAYGGDGSTSAGDFHEACNLAAVAEAPVVFLVTNNQWAISTPVHKQTKVVRLAEKAAAYGMPGVRVDSFDVFACYEVIREAAARARQGHGPTLIVSGPRWSRWGARPLPFWRRGWPKRISCRRSERARPGRSWPRATAFLSTRCRLSTRSRTRCMASLPGALARTACANPDGYWTNSKWLS